MTTESALVQQFLKALDELNDKAEALPLEDLYRLEEEMPSALKTVSEIIGRKQVHTVFEGYAVDPLLPVGFSHLPNEDRPESHRFWWCRPYIETHGSQDKPCYWVHCLDGGCWDRPTWWGEAETLEAAAEICRSGPNWNKPQ